MNMSFRQQSLVSSISAIAGPWNCVIDGDRLGLFLVIPSVY